MITVKHPFIFLEKSGFGSYFCNAMKSLYANGNSCVKLTDGTGFTRREDFIKDAQHQFLFLAVACLSLY